MPLLPRQTTPKSLKHFFPALQPADSGVFRKPMFDFSGSWIASLSQKTRTVLPSSTDQIVPMLSLGGKGVISVLSNVAPKVTHDIAKFALDGDIKASKELQLEYLDLCNALFCDVNPIPVKEALCLMGKDVGRCRMPLSPINEKNKAILVKALKNHNLI